MARKLTEGKLRGGSGAAKQQAVEGKERADLERESKRRNKSTKSTNPEDAKRNIEQRIRRGEGEPLCVMRSGYSLYKVGRAYCFYQERAGVLRILPPDFMRGRKVVNGLLVAK
jgi:hypothetical protein